jgi:hypothetical protein
MPARAPRGPIHLRPRSTTALIASRSDAPTAGKLPGSAETLAGREQDSARRATGQPDGPKRVWPTVLTWAVLSAVIAALWALLLLGDSLRLSG